MKRIAAFLFFVLLFAPLGHAQSDSSIHVKAFPGSTVGEKVSNAMLTCPVAPVPCILVIDGSLAAAATGTIPNMCGNCYLDDYRTGPPTGASYPGVTSNGLGLNIIGASSVDGIVDGFLPTRYTWQLTTGYGGATDECAKLAQLGSNIHSNQNGFTFISAGQPTSNPLNCSMSPFDPALLSNPFPSANNVKVKLTPNAIYQMTKGEMDMCEGCDLDGQSVYPESRSPQVGTYITPASSFPLPLTTVGPGPVLLNLGIQSTTSSESIDAYDRVHNLGLDCQFLPYMIGLFNGVSQQGMEASNIYIRNCQYGVFVDDFSNGGGGSQNHGPFHDIGVTPLNMATTPIVTGFQVTAGGSYSQCPTATVTGCTTNPVVTPICTSTAVTSVFLTNNGGASCSPGTAAITFSTAFGSGATATPVVQSPPTPIGFRLGGIHGGGGGSYERDWVVGGQDSINLTQAFTIDNNDELLRDIYSESNWVGMCIGCHTANAIGGIKVDGLRGEASNNAMQTMLQFGTYTSQGKQIAANVTGINGNAAYFVIDGQIGGGSLRRREAWGASGVASYIRNGRTVFSTDPDQPNTGMTYANLYFNCGSACNSTTQPRQFVPIKNVAGYAEAMSLSDTSEPIGIALAGNFDTTNTHYVSVAYAGEAPCRFDPSVTVTPGDYVIASANTVIGGQSVAGCVDAGSSLPTGWNIGRIVAMGTTGSAVIPSTPSAGTLTASANNGVSYSYQVTAATEYDWTESAPSSTMTTAVGPASLLAGQNVKITGLANGIYNIYRTADGSSSLPTLTPVCCSNGTVTGISGMPAGTGYTFGPTGTFSGGGCSQEPSLNGPLIVSGGQIVNYNLATFGVGCTSAPTLNLTKSIYETGWISQISGTSFTDNGIGGDGSTPPSAGVIETLVAIHPMHN